MPMRKLQRPSSNTAAKRLYAKCPSSKTKQSETGA